MEVLEHEQVQKATQLKVGIFNYNLMSPADYGCRVVYVCVSTLAILDRLDEVDQDTLGWWLAERQLPNGGLNGRPEKLEDVCYSFWVLSAMSILNKLTWINADKLIAFILSGQVRQVAISWDGQANRILGPGPRRHCGQTRRPTGCLPYLFRGSRYVWLWLMNLSSY